MKKDTMALYIEYFDSLSPENKVYLCEVMMRHFRFGKFDESQKGRISEIEKFFKELNDEEKENKQLKGLLPNFNKLSKKNKLKVIKSLLSELDYYTSIQKQEDKEAICEREGHVYGEWEYRTWTTEELVWDNGPMGYIPVEHEEWYRNCSRCGYHEHTDNKPEEIRAEEKKQRILELKKEIAKLEEE